MISRLELLSMKAFKHFNFSLLEPLLIDLGPFDGVLQENGIIYCPQVLLLDYSISSNRKTMKILTIDD